MFGVLVVVLCRDGIAILSFNPGQRQISNVRRELSASSLNLRNPSGHHATQSRDLSAAQV